MKRITLIPGDGIGPEVVRETVRIIDSFQLGIQWDVQIAGLEAIEKYHTPLPDHVLQSIKTNHVALKGPLTTPVGTGFRSVNVQLRKALDLYANIRPLKSLKGIPSRYHHVDLVVVRENTEDLYMGIGHMVDKDTAESIKRFTRKGCRRILRYAFEYASTQNRRKVTAVHKANIMKLTDVMFLEEARNISKDYPDIIFEDMIIDAMCMKLVLQPEQYDVLVLPNLYGDIVSDLCAGLVGGLGVAPGANIGHHGAIFEPIHGSAPDIAGKGLANPVAMMLTGVYMLHHIGYAAEALQMEKAIHDTLGEGRFLTKDLGGNCSTEQFSQHVLEKIKKNDPSKASYTKR